MCLHKEAFAAIVQTEVESHSKNTDVLLLSKLIEFGKSPSPALTEEIMKLDAFKDIKQHIIVSTTGTESQMTVKCLKDVSRMLVILSKLREGGLNEKSWN